MMARPKIKYELLAFWSLADTSIKKPPIITQMLTNELNIMITLGLGSAAYTAEQLQAMPWTTVGGRPAQVIEFES